ncbi:TetR/AcrR family transcriptional regulator [Nocardioides sp.]|uniref:TetR/AcrR family transcriptional regulator n=1 Tax=Nocardioides sp. TaxID=35761 RepID=UPI0025F801F5|nr:TetR/AcrR family transcriptional regulator [Nocardioides sp.]
MTTATPTAGSGSPAPRRRENTRARLVEASFGVFVEKGLKPVTVDDLVGAAGYTRGAFYSNFSSIEEVFFEVFRERGEGMLAAASTAMEAVPEEDFTIESIGSVLDAVRAQGREWYILHAEFTLLALRDERARAVLADFSERFRVRLAAVIEDVLRRLGRVADRPTEELAEMVAALHLHALGQGLVGSAVLGADGISMDTVSALVLGFSRPA